MAESVRCPKCDSIFSSMDSYESHLPCHGSSNGGTRETAEEYISQRLGLVIVSVDSVFEAAKTIQDKQEFQILLEE